MQCETKVMCKIELFGNNFEMISAFYFTQLHVK